MVIMKNQLDELADLVYKLGGKELRKGLWSDLELEKIIMLLYRLETLQAEIKKVQNQLRRKNPCQE